MSLVVRKSTNYKDFYDRPELLRKQVTDKNMGTKANRKLGGSSLAKVNLSEKFALFKDRWSPKIVSQLNDSYVKLVKLKGEFVWHSHPNEDEMFLVIRGQLTVRLREKNVNLRKGEFLVVPRGVEHKPVASSEAQIVLIEKKTTRNTGQLRNQRTVEKLERI